MGNNNKIHPLEVAAFKYIQNMNNILKKAGQEYFYTLEIQSAPETIQVPIKGTKNKKPKKFMIGNLLFGIEMPRDEGEPKRLLLHHGRVILKGINERFNDYGWHGDLCGQLLSTAFTFYGRESLNNFIKQQKEDEAKKTA